MGTKKILVCADGTANNPDDQTNVCLFHKALHNPELDQIAWYDPGVGVSFGTILRGRAFGRGVSKNIQQGFEFVCNAYQEGAKIYLFGFSRGAYTVRSLASMISLCGLPPKGSHKKVLHIFWKAYKQNRHSDFESIAKGLKEEFGAVVPPIEAVCVWDTVGAIGRQVREADIRKKMWHRYHRMNVWEPIKRMYHAVSLDERRTQYFPHLLHGQGMGDEQVIQEVWFPGVHSDIGGGYADDRSLANLALTWMVDQLKDELAFDPDFLKKYVPNPLGPLHNTEGGIIFSLFRKRNRPVARGTKLHRSIPIRIAGPLERFHPHREPSGNYEPLALSLAKFSNPPDFSLARNYQIVD